MKAKYTSIGGQALIEGVMMRNGHHVSMAVRKPNGQIELIEEYMGVKSGLWSKIPLLRGVIALFSAMTIGIKALTWSASFFDEDGQEDEIEKQDISDTFVGKVFGKYAETMSMVGTILFSVIMAFALFGVLPTVVVSLFKKWIESAVILSILEGLLKIVLFVGYIVAISMMKEIHRVFEYHGAEHKSIFCYEHGLELTPENARQFSRLHPRCGTSFLVFVLIISIAIFSFLSWSSPIVRVLLKFVFLPVIAGVSFEVIKLAGSCDNVIVRAISTPGLLMQKITTKEPDDSQLEVALAALNAVLKDDDPLKRTDILSVENKSENKCKNTDKNKYGNKSEKTDDENVKEFETKEFENIEEMKTKSEANA